jgi:hypothetical protein
VTLGTLKQGDVRLLDTDIAQGLLASTELARVAYVVADGTPRIFPVMFHWNGTELVFATFAGAAKIKALRARPAVAITIDTNAMPPSALLLRGNAEVTDVDGVVPEYLLAHIHYFGEEQGRQNAADVDKPGLRMARIAIKPTWVGTFDFMTRLPGGATPEEFAKRGQS